MATCPTIKAAGDLDSRALAWYAAFRSAAVGANTLIGELGYVRAVYRFALDEGWIARNPFSSKRWRVRAVDPALKRYHPLGDVARVIAYLSERSGHSWESHRLYALASTVAYTGLRRNEALYLQCGDVDLTAGVLSVVARRRLKTAGASQPVPIPAGLAGVLRLWLPEAGPVWLWPNAGRTGPWVGGSPGSKPLDRLKAAGAAVGVPAFTWQSLRHSWATAAEGRWGLTDAQIQRALRHTRPLTQRRYRHADLENLRRIGDRVEIPAPGDAGGEAA